MISPEAAFAKLSAPAETQALLRCFGDIPYAFVGGCVRDTLMEGQPYDIDMVLDAACGEVFTLLQTALAGKCNHYPDYHRVKVKLADIPYDIFCLKSAPNIMQGHTLEERLHLYFKQGDFTINCFGLCEGGQVVDPYNGLEDIRQKRIYFIDMPDKVIKDSPIRIIRYFRFLALCGSHSHEQASTDAISQHVHLLQNASQPHIRRNLMRLLELGDPYAALTHMQQLRVLEHAVGTAFRPLSMLARLKEVEQLADLQADSFTRLLMLFADAQQLPEKLLARIEKPWRMYASQMRDMRSRLEAYPQLGRHTRDADVAALARAIGRQNAQEALLMRWAMEGDVQAAAAHYRALLRKIDL
jgi:tRNA nucleotidyltransferase/poly(A) polymerase